jgi:hypothetical protein
MPETPPYIDQVKRLSAELDRRIANHRRLEPYLVGQAPTPALVSDLRITRLYRHLMPLADAPWGSLVVDSKLDRLEVAGISDPDKNAARRVWEEAWQTNGMDAESKLGHGAALLDGRFYATVWGNDDGTPDIALDDVTQMVVEFQDGSRRHRTGALRRWAEDGRVYATLYRPDGIYKYQGPADSAVGPTASTEWERRVVADEDWPLANPFGVVPVVEIRVNPRLAPGRFPYARGEFEHCLGLLDQINLLTFLGLIVAVYMGFPIRGVTGDKIRREVLKDDDGNPLVDENTGKERTRALPPFDVSPDRLFQLENPEAKIVQYEAADRRNLRVFAELDQLAVITKTPRHYFPLEQGMSNLSAEAIMASEGGMHAAVTGHKASIGEGWEEVCRLAGRILGVELSQQASMLWMKHESRSLAEQADAFVKLAGSNGNGLPWMAAAEVALNLTQDQLARWQSQQAMNPLTQLITAAQTPRGIPAG